MSHALTSDLGCYKVRYVTQKYPQCFSNPPRSLKKPGEITLDSQGCIPRWKPPHHPGMEPKPCRGRPLMSGFFWSNSRMGLLDNILGRPGKSTTSSCTRPSIICSNSSNAANVSEPCYMSACSTHSSFASPLEREWGKPSPTRSWILYGNVREFGDSEGSSRKRCLFFLIAVKGFYSFGPPPKVAPQYCGGMSMVFGVLRRAPNDGQYRGHCSCKKAKPNMCIYIYMYMYA